MQNGIIFYKTDAFLCMQNFSVVAGQKLEVLTALYAIDQCNLTDLKKYVKANDYYPLIHSLVTTLKGGLRESESGTKTCWDDNRNGLNIMHC